MKIDEIAELNFEQCLSQNPYPGRGLVIGRSDRDTWLMIYWIMGRSTNSRNRRFVAEGGTLRTELVDRCLVSDPGIIIYEAMLELPRIYLVSNGDQTRTMYETLQNGRAIEEALEIREREPDAPHYTPRISGMLSFGKPTRTMVLSILKVNPINTDYTDRYFYHPAMPEA
jgi:IMP cyclohydrolase